MGDAINKVREQLGKMAEDVLREAAIPGEIEKGWELEIICFADAEKRLNSFYGSWGVVLHPPKGQSEQ